MTHPDIGKRLAGKYELVALAGEGGMAEVFKAITHGAAGFRRHIAIKRLLEHLSEDPEFVAMFVEEARVTAALQHPNIVQIHDFDQDADDVYFLVMEWVEGMNMLAWLRGHEAQGRQTPWHLVTAVGIEVLKALSAAHENVDERGQRVPVYHRDVTPQNILMSANGVVRLTDFGLARAMDRARMTRPQMVKGKLSYLAPEIAAGSDPSVQSDLFGVGIVMWEALAGGKLFDGATPLEILQQVKECDIPPLGDIRPTMPRSLNDAIHRALCAEPEKRFKSARSMVRTLANILRMTPESTSAEVIAKSVRSAGDALGHARPRGASTQTFDLDAAEGSDAALALTRRKQ
ncbi:MAG: serine/threonine-protein kinase [Myxococcota bacterium]